MPILGHPPPPLVVGNLQDTKSWILLLPSLGLGFTHLLMFGPCLPLPAHIYLLNLITELTLFIWPLTLFLPFFQNQPQSRVWKFHFVLPIPSHPESSTLNQGPFPWLRPVCLHLPFKGQTLVLIVAVITNIEFHTLDREIELSWGSSCFCIPGKGKMEFHWKLFFFLL